MTAAALTFLGATGTVTGSRFLVEEGDLRILVEAGLYQGPKELRLRNWEPLPVPPDSLHSVVLSHAHLDHCGYLPRLVKQGFSGPVRCTPATADLVGLVLRDSAHLQEEDAAYANASGYSRHRPALPLYDTADVGRSLRLLAPVGLHQPVRVGSGGPPELLVTFAEAGHILGSATVLVEAVGTRVLFSGDLGRPHHPLLPAREDPPAADIVVLESTYGDRRHPESSTVLREAVRRTIGRGGSVLIPAFAVDRTELVLLELGRLMQQGRIPTVPVYVDSPMALAVLEIYRRTSLVADVAPDFGIPDLRAARSVAESQLLNRPSVPCVVVSASGMASGGRVLHHLLHQLPDHRNTVVLGGYQAQGTRGRALADGARQLKIHGRYVAVQAEVVQESSFSAHADAEEVVEWLAKMPQPPRTVFLVHGEPAASLALAARVEQELGWTAVVPSYGERVRID